MVDDVRGLAGSPGRQDFGLKNGTLDDLLIHRDAYLIFVIVLVHQFLKDYSYRPGKAMPPRQVIGLQLCDPLGRANWLHTRRRGDTSSQTDRSSGSRCHGKKLAAAHLLCHLIPPWFSVLSCSLTHGYLPPLSKKRTTNLLCNSHPPFLSPLRARTSLCSQAFPISLIPRRTQTGVWQHHRPRLPAPPLLRAQPAWLCLHSNQYPPVLRQ